EEAKAEKLTKEVLAEDYDKTKPPAVAPLPTKMIKQAADKKDAPATRFVLLREARELAVRAGDLGQSLRAIDELAREFAVDGLALKVATLEKSERLIITQVGNQNLASGALAVADEALAADQYDLAGPGLKVGQASAP